RTPVAAAPDLAAAESPRAGSFLVKDLALGKGFRRTVAGVRAAFAGQASILRTYPTHPRRPTCRRSQRSLRATCNRGRSHFEQLRRRRDDGIAQEEAAYEREDSRKYNRAT